MAWRVTEIQTKEFILKGTPWKINGWKLQITHLDRNVIFQTSMIMFHVNLPGCIPTSEVLGQFFEIPTGMPAWKDSPGIHQSLGYIGVKWPTDSNILLTFLGKSKKTQRDIPQNYPLYKMCMGSITKGTVPIFSGYHDFPYDRPIPILGGSSQLVSGQ